MLAKEMRSASEPSPAQHFDPALLDEHERGLVGGDGP
jgi:hypothetical protein